MVDSGDVISHKDEAAAATRREEGGTTAADTECETSPDNRNGYALTDVIDDLMAAEFPETTAPQADAEEVVLLSPTPPTFPPPPPPSEPEVDKPEVMEGDDGERAAAGHPGTHEPRVTFSGPLQFMGRNDLPRDDQTPPLSPVSSPVKLLDVLPAPLKDAAAVEASLARSIPVTSGSIDAVTADDTQSPWSAGAETSHAEDQDQQEVFNETSTTVDVDITGRDDNAQDDELRQTDLGDSPGAVEPTSTNTEYHTSELSAFTAVTAAESSSGVSRLWAAWLRLAT